MAKGRCKKRMINVAKVVAKELSPIGVKLIATITGIVGTTDWSSDEKREKAVEMAKGALKSRAIEAKESTIRLATEASVTALKQAGEWVEEAGDLPDEDLTDPIEGIA